ncbi:MAG: YihY/virulence factor BrkB family protein [Treponema sp.]|jgi:membrane protein|nr:YihY/virulence factor BrkB family protein [Treponema sp.]
MKNKFFKIILPGRTFFQRFFITLQLYSENGLANHAAACAYGFLLSMAPMLLLILFFMFIVFEPSPRVISTVVGSLPFLDTVFDEQWLNSDFFSFSNPGIPGVISVLSVFWAARIFALSIQRGLKFIFQSEKSRNPVTNTVITLAIEASVIIFAVITIISSQTAMRLYRLFDFLGNSPLHIITTQIGGRIFLAAILGIVSFLAYILIPVKSPRKISAFQGAFVCAVCYFCVALGLGFFLNISRINFIYGTLGNLIVLLINVFFFFSFFFLGAQLVFVIDSFDALLFTKLRQTKMMDDAYSAAKISAGETKNAVRFKHPQLLLKLLFPFEGHLNKYLRHFRKDEVIISQGDKVDDIYYLIEGEVEVFFSLSAQDIGSSTGILSAGSFFGEMGYLLSEERCATVMAKTDIYVFALPPGIFEEILKHDTSLDRDIIEHMSRRLKDTTEQIISLKTDN